MAKTIKKNNHEEKVEQQLEDIKELLREIVELLNLIRK